MMPRHEALGLAGYDEDTLLDVLKDLLVKPRTVTFGSGWQSFTVLSQVEWIKEGNFLLFQVNPIFLKWLN